VKEDRHAAVTNTVFSADSGIPGVYHPRTFLTALNYSSTCHIETR
jgi:hypothetical protein